MQRVNLHPLPSLVPVPAPQPVALPVPLPVPAPLPARQAWRRCALRLACVLGSWPGAALTGVALTGLALPAMSATAQPLPAATALPASAVSEALALLAEAARAVAPAGARVQTQAGTPDARLRLAPCSAVQAFLVPGANPWGRTRVGLRCTEGAARWTVHLPVTVQVWAPAVVPAGPLPAGASLQPEQLQMAEVDWAAAVQPPFDNLAHLSGRVLARAVLPGQALRAPDLRARQWFAAGDPVRVVARGPGFAVSADGQAANAGIEGQRVRVRIGENRLVEGRAVGPRLVEVGP